MNILVMLKPHINLIVLTWGQYSAPWKAKVFSIWNWETVFSIRKGTEGYRMVNLTTEVSIRGPEKFTDSHTAGVSGPRRRVPRACGLSACGLVCTWSSNTLSQVLIEKAAAHLAKARVTCPLFLTEAPIFFLSSNSKNQLGPVVLFYKLTSMLPPDKESDFLKKCSHL